MKTTTRITNTVQLTPADEVTITVDRPMAIQVVNADTEEPVDVHLAKQWGTERELRQEVIRLRGRVKHLNWLLEHPDAYAPRRTRWQLIRDALRKEGTR